jgi:hypothetical protein
VPSGHRQGAEPLLQALHAWCPRYRFRHSRLALHSTPERIEVRQRASRAHVRRVQYLVHKRTDRGIHAAHQSVLLWIITRRNVRCDKVLDQVVDYGFLWIAVLGRTCWSARPARPDISDHPLICKLQPRF